MAFNSLTLYIFASIVIGALITVVYFSLAKMRGWSAVLFCSVTFILCAATWPVQLIALSIIYFAPFRKRSPKTIRHGQSTENV